MHKLALTSLITAIVLWVPGAVGTMDGWDCNAMTLVRDFALVALIMFPNCLIYAQVCKYYERRDHQREAEIKRLEERDRQRQAEIQRLEDEIERLKDEMKRLEAEYKRREATLICVTEWAMTPPSDPLPQPRPIYPVR